MPIPLQLLIGALVGASIGALIAKVSKCSDGSCPLVATPWRGAIFGAIFGLLFSFTATLEQPTRNTPPANQAEQPTPLPQEAPAPSAAPEDE